MAMQAIPEQFSLRWNDFYTNLSTSFQAFLAAKDLVDVTLAADGQYVHAHKLILSICSPYFKELFKNNPCEHPIVFLKDVTQHELQQLLQFMYRGEVHVRQQELSGFLHTAEMLQVKGLTGGGRERSESPPNIPDEPPQDIKVQQPLEHSMDSMKDWDIGCDDIVSDSVEPSSSPAEITENKSPLRRLLKNTHPKNSYKVKKEPQRPVKDGFTENSDYPSDCEPTLTEFDTEEQMLHHHSVLVVPKKDGWNCKTAGAKCPSCHRIFANRYNLKVHIRDKHDTREGTLQCEICQKRMRNPSCLRVHMYHHRKQAAYLAQIAAPTDMNMTQLVHGMVGMKQAWRADMSPGMREIVDMENKANAVAGMKPGWRSEMAPGIADLSEIENKAAALAGLSKLKQGWRSNLSTSLNDDNDEKMIQGMAGKIPGWHGDTPPDPENVDDNMQGMVPKKTTWSGEMSPDQDNAEDSIPSSTPAAQSPNARDDIEAIVDEDKNVSE